MQARSSDGFFRGVGGLLSILLGALALIIVGFFTLYPGCHVFPSPPILCNGFVSMPLLYAGLASILFGFAIIEGMRNVSNPKIATQTAIYFTLPIRIRRVIGKCLYVLGAGFLFALLIGSIQWFFFVNTASGMSGFGLWMFRFDPISMTVYIFVTVALAFLGVRLCPTIRRSIVRYTGVGLILSSIIVMWPVIQFILQYR